MSILTPSSSGAPTGAGDVKIWSDDRFTAELDAEFAACLAEAPGRPAPLVDAMRYAVLGPGKRLRPRLVGYAAHACGGDWREALPAAAAVEFIHAYSLVHDDLPAMDDDDLRRGRPTVHKQFDEALAILAGDALQALAFEALATRLTDPNVAVRACAELAKAAGPAALVGGQVDDLAGADSAPVEPTARLKHLEQIHARKTGAMISVSLRLGALIAGADDAAMSRITEYGRAVGMAFQVTDDLLDAVGTEEAMGKRVGKDAGLGKLTYPGLLGIEASREYAAELIDVALAAVESFDDRAEPLRSLARQILKRDR